MLLGWVPIRRPGGHACQGMASLGWRVLTFLTPTLLARLPPALGFCCDGALCLRSLENIRCAMASLSRLSRASVINFWKLAAFAVAMMMPMMVIVMIIRNYVIDANGWCVERLLLLGARICEVALVALSSSLG
jgi:hypothetical protein